MKISAEYIGLTPFLESLKLMEGYFIEAVQQKKCFVIGCQHPLVYTSGLKTEKEHILKNVEIVSARRGGSVTLHNPGQLMFYTVLPLKESPGGLVAHIRKLENCIIYTLKKFHVNAFRHEEYTGVWTLLGKIAFIGLGLKKGCIYHGSSINLFNNLQDYNSIRSCGLDEPITRLADEPGFQRANMKISVEDFFQALKEEFIRQNG